jgi:hypothetical protein
MKKNIKYTASRIIFHTTFVHGRTGPGVDSASNRNEYQESFKIIKKPGGKVRLARRDDNLAAIY